MVTQDIQTLSARFVDGWQHPFPATYDGQPVVDQPATGWVMFTVRPGSSEHYAGDVENGLKLQLGRVWLNVFVPPQTGFATALEAIEAFCTIFRNWQSDDYALTCKTEDMNAPTLDRESGMTMYSVSIPWESARTYQ